jgi:NitT/TauT family transport system ATP-binding protein
MSWGANSKNLIRGIKHDHARPPPADSRAPVERSAVSMSAQAISKRFRHRGEWVEALSNTTLKLAPAEFVCLLGPSGCGKTTLLNIFAGFIKPDSGSLYIGDTPIAAPGPDRCVLFQTPTLFSWLTIADNVLFGPKCQGLLNADVKERAHQLLSKVGLAQFANHYPHQLSGGMRYRAAFARALMNQPPVLLLDEPFAALDAITRHHMQDFLLQLWEDFQMTVLFVTHDVDEAVLLADRTCVMSARPARIVGEQESRLPRPRSRALVETAAFLESRHRINALLEDGMA